MMLITMRGLALTVAGAVSLMASAAPRFDPSGQPLGSIAPIVLSNTDLSDGGVTAYRPWFENGAWQGDIIQYDVLPTGALDTTLEFSGTSPAQDGSTRADGMSTNWSALVKFAEAEGADPKSSTYYTRRKIITANNGVQKPFLWDITFGNISKTNLEAIDQAAVDAQGTDSIVFNWLRGDRSNEYPAPAALRKRTSIMGAVIHSNPVYVGNPRASLTEDRYAQWAADPLRKNRDHRVYAGANDGMLHAFDAATGSEVWAYIPSMVIPNLSKLTARPYENTYFVDGKLTVADAYFTHAGVTAWRTVLVGSLGAGGRGIFALDITNADMNSQSATSGTDIKVLWELGATDNPIDDDLGDSFSRPVIAKLNDDTWYTIVGNGYNSVNGEAILYLINMDTKKIKKIGTGSGTSGSPNGLSTPRLLDENRDGKMDYAYAGDIDGNLWKFNLESAEPRLWAKDYPLHIGAPNQAITTAPVVTRLLDDGSFLVAFATGRLLQGPDALDQTVQAMYGLKDPGQLPVWISNGTAQDLVSQTFKPVTYSTGATVSAYGAHNVDDASIAVYSPNVEILDTQDGWKVAFPAGYRVLENLQIRDGRAKVTITLPRESPRNTASSGLNWLSEGSILDGGPHPTPIFNLNLDRVLGAADLTDGNENGTVSLLEPEDVPMAWQRPDGIMSQVTIAQLANGIDTLYLNFLVPPVEEPCTEDCGGFQGGHIDVDTWLDGVAYGGGSTKHEHEYDKKVDRVFVDFFDLNVPLPAGAEAPRKASTGHVDIGAYLDEPAPSSGIDSNTPFVVLVANADFSRGSEMQLGTKFRNVVEYQIEIHRALINWNAADPNDALVDSDGDSLVFTWGEIAAAKGTIKHSFTDVSILAGGLHPTQTGCVKGSAYDTFDESTNKGRWRNGALTTQLIKASYFKSTSAINDVIVQDPDDLPLTVSVGSDNRQIKLWNDVNDNNMIDAGDPNEVRYAGLIAKSGSEHIWESTLFWHFGKLNDIVYGGKPCYGDEDWARAAELETSANPFATILEANDIVDLDQEILANTACSTDKDKDSITGCADYYKFLLKLKKLEDDYTPLVNPDSGGSGGDGETPKLNMGGVPPLDIRTDGVTKLRVASALPTL